MKKFMMRWMNKRQYWLIWLNSVYERKKIKWCWIQKCLIYKPKCFTKIIVYFTYDTYDQNIEKEWERRC